MSKLVFDLESNGFLPTLTKIHSLVCYDLDTDLITSGVNDSALTIQLAKSGKYYGLSDCLKLLAEAEEIIGHNIIKFDIPVIQKLYPDFKPKKVFDTLIASKLAFPDIADVDIIMERKGRYSIPAELKKKPYSLEAWGYRLGIYKGSFCKQENAFEEWTPELQSYCEQDVRVTVALYKKLMNPAMDKRKLSQESLDIEFKFAEIISLQERRGVKFNTDKAIALTGKLIKRKLELIPELKKYFKDKIKKEVFIPKKNNKIKGYVAGEPFIKKKRIPFNPNSRDMVREQLLKFWDWKPIKKTKSGNWALDKEVLADMCEEKVTDKDGNLILKYPFAPILEEYYIIEKLLGSLQTGEQSWLNHVTKEGRIHGSVNTIGAATGRCTHNNPNLAQIPACGKPFGKECRELFEASKGYKLVGCDASGLEFRCLAHYINDPKINKTVIEGVKEDGTDIHSLNMKILQEIEPNVSRDDAKTYIYAWMYGGGDAKLGSIIGKSAQVGKKLRELFLSKYPALEQLIKQANEQIKTQGFIRGIDGRYIAVKSSHKALNYTLQSAGAIVMKKALNILYEDLTNLGWSFGKEYAFVLNVHDEYQAEVLPELVEQYKELATAAIRKAGEYFNFNCPLDGEAVVGMNWSETH